MESTQICFHSLSSRFESSSLSKDVAILVVSLLAAILHVFVSCILASDRKGDAIRVVSCCRDVRCIAFDGCLYVRWVVWEERRFFSYEVCRFVGRSVRLRAWWISVCLSVNIVELLKVVLRRNTNMYVKKRLCSQIDIDLSVPIWLPAQLLYIGNFF